MKDKAEPRNSSLIKSPNLKIITNAEVPKDDINDIIEEQGLIAQQFIEEEIEDWELVPIILTGVHYKRGDD